MSEEAEDVAFSTGAQMRGYGCIGLLVDYFAVGVKQDKLDGLWSKRVLVSGWLVAEEAANVAVVRGSISSCRRWLVSYECWERASLPIEDADGCNKGNIDLQCITGG